MNRHYHVEAAVLRTRRFGDVHKSVLLLSRELGIVEAVVHGAYRGKSRMGSITEPFCVCSFDLYNNPVKNSWKINDCEPAALNEELKADLNAVYTASLWSEVIIKSHAGGDDYGSIYELYTDALACLNGAPQRNVCRVLVQFLYRFLFSSGFFPDASVCGRCGKDYKGPERVYLMEGMESFVCSGCSTGSSRSLSAGAVKYLEFTSSLNLADAVKIGLDSASLKELQSVLVSVLKYTIEVPLKTLDYISYDME